MGGVETVQCSVGGVGLYGVGGVETVWVEGNYIYMWVECKQCGWSGSIKCLRIMNNVGGV